MSSHSRTSLKSSYSLRLILTHPSPKLVRKSPKINHRKVVTQAEPLDPKEAAASPPDTDFTASLAPSDPSTEDSEWTHWTTCPGYSQRSKVFV
uniref:Uncharacterized protein n=1 Tax=Mustela putorius furo TaxID=9669 RepID=M3YG00_MUSPF